MLEVRNLTKIYTPKNGVAVTALDDVTLSFPETGMVFLLGKSGSGKSTLLNVCGGLDSPTSGEIIVKGRSSKDFSRQDFDSYRNTFVGFIFQEYNILNEFSVEDNISLALELQNKRKDKAAVQKLLEDVDLAGYANRKPNTLSGGQKQRIAIARALIKSPEIIMADEPSGALDSATGKQVFETLKKLSKDKLVLVVSHDRDFAELYGDRIIELKDGKVISDVSKNLQQQVALTENIASTKNVLCIKQGATLSDKDFAEIKRFISQTSSDVIITGGEREVKNFKKSNRINDDGAQEVFQDTAPSERKSYRPEDSRFISSRLPLRHAIKIGFSGLKSKPVRLFFTIVLCTIAFIMFGLFSTMSFYNSESTFKESLMNSQQNIMCLRKDYITNVDWYQQGELMHSYKSSYYATFTSAEITEMKGIYGNDVFAGVQADLSYNIRSAVSSYWRNQIEVIACLSQDNTLRQTIVGKYPEKDNELCISSYAANVLLNCQTFDESGNTITFQSSEEIIGKQLNIRGKNYTVTGIFDSGTLPEKYDALKGDTTESDNGRLMQQFYTELTDGLHLVAFATEGTVKEVASNENFYKPSKTQFQRIAATMVGNGDVQLPDYNNSIYVGISELTDNTKVYYIDKSALGDGDVIVDTMFFTEFAVGIFDQKRADLTDDRQLQYYDTLINTCYELQSGGVWNYNEDTKESYLTPFTQEEFSKKASDVLQALVKEKAQAQLAAQLIDDSTRVPIGDRVTLNVIGFWAAKDPQQADRTIYIPDNMVTSLLETAKSRLEYYEEYSTNYVQDPDAFYTKLYLPYDRSQAQTDTYWEIYKSDAYRSDDTRITLSGYLLESLAMADSTIESMSKVFLYVGIALAAFAALLFSNFISVSISQKRRDIGILRAVGAKSTDVFKIFFSESAFIATICILISTAASVFISGYINTELAASIGVSLLVFGVPSFVILVSIAILTAVLATFFPVYSAARKKPIDSIRAV